MGNSAPFFYFYFNIIAKLVENFPDVDLGIWWYEKNSITFQIKIPSAKSEANIVKILKEYIYINYSIYNEIMTFEQYLDDLRTDNQIIRYDLLNNYLLFDINFTNDKYFQNYLKRLILNMEYSNVGKIENTNDIDLISDIQHCNWEIDKILLNENVMNFEKDYNGNDRKLFTNLNIFMTYMIINLDGLIKNFKRKYLIINTFLQNFSIEPYYRIKRNKEFKINSIEKLIEHYRDAVCHSEDSSKDIRKSNLGNIFKLSVHSTKNDYIFHVGNGKISFNNQIKPLIRGLKLFFIPYELNVISVKK